MAGEVNALLEQYKALSRDLQGLYVKNQQFNMQDDENKSVKAELDLLDSNASVYKLVGPALVKQSLDDAKENVSKRIEYIAGELEKVATQIAEKTEAQRKLGDDIAQIQMKMREDAVKAAESVTK